MPYAPEHITAQQDGLMAEVGTWPADGTYRLYTGDPTQDGVELTVEAGYVHLAGSAATWAVDAGEPSITATLAYTATAAWSDVADFWGLHDSDGALRFYEALPEPFDVEAAGSASTTITIFYAHDFEED